MIRGCPEWRAGFRRPGSSRNKGNGPRPLGRTCSPRHAGLRSPEVARYSAGNDPRSEQFEIRRVGFKTRMSWNPPAAMTAWSACSAMLFYSDAFARDVNKMTGGRIDRISMPIDTCVQPLLNPYCPSGRRFRASGFPAWPVVACRAIQAAKEPPERIRPNAGRGNGMRKSRWNEELRNSMGRMRAW